MTLSSTAQITYEIRQCIQLITHSPTIIIQSKFTSSALTHDYYCDHNYPSLRYLTPSPPEQYRHISWIRSSKFIWSSSLISHISCHSNTSIHTCRHNMLLLFRHCGVHGKQHAHVVLLSPFLVNYSTHASIWNSICLTPISLVKPHLSPFRFTRHHILFTIHTIEACVL